MALVRNVMFISDTVHLVEMRATETQEQNGYSITEVTDWTVSASITI
jgi:hypothetical protein